MAMLIMSRCTGQSNLAKLLLLRLHALKVVKDQLGLHRPDSTVNLELVGIMLELQIGIQMLPMYPRECKRYNRVLRSTQCSEHRPEEENDNLLCASPVRRSCSRLAPSGRKYNIAETQGILRPFNYCPV